jgi:hypothetical protein
MNKTLVIGIIGIMTLVTYGAAALTILAAQPSYGILTTTPEERKAPIVISGDNTYIAWWTNNTGNDEVNFRASTDGGATFTDKINLSNSTGAESQDAQIAAEGDNVIVTWWERNQTAEEPVARISNDNGQTFSPLLRLATNGTIGGSSDTE